MSTGSSRARGHQAVPHTADVRIEAWAPTREECLAEAVHGLVASFAEIPPDTPARQAVCHLAAATDADLLADALDEVIYRMDSADEIPACAQVRPAAGGGIELLLSVAPVQAAEIVGAVPKAVSLQGIRCAPEPSGRWSASVTVDV